MSALRDTLEAAEQSVNAAYAAFLPLAMNRTAVPADMCNAALALWKAAELKRDSILAQLTIGHTTSSNS